jgi:hypothetical protein
MAATQRNGTGLSAEFAQKNVNVPASGNDITNKTYVDAAVAAAASGNKLAPDLGDIWSYGKISDGEQLNLTGRTTDGSDPTHVLLQIYGAVLTSNSGDSVLGSGSRITSSAGSFDVAALAFVFTNLTPNFPMPTYLPRIRGKFKTYTSIANLRIWFGMFASSPNASATIPANSVGIRYESGTDTAFQCITKDGSTANVQTSGVTVAINTVYEFEIRYIANGNVEFYIGVAGAAMTLVATSSGNLPVTTTLMKVFIGLVGIDKASPAGINLIFSYVYFAQK